MITTEGRMKKALGEKMFQRKNFGHLRTNRFAANKTVIGKNSKSKQKKL